MLKLFCFSSFTWVIGVIFLPMVTRIQCNLLVNSVQNLYLSTDYKNLKVNSSNKVTFGELSSSAWNLFLEAGLMRVIKKVEIAIKSSIIMYIFNSTKWNVKCIKNRWTCHYPVTLGYKIRLFYSGIMEHWMAPLLYTRQRSGWKKNEKVFKFVNLIELFLVHLKESNYENSSIK